MLDQDGQKSRQVTLNIKDIGSKFINTEVLEDQDAFVICFDITNDDSFFQISKIASMLQEIFIEEGGKNKPIVIAGLKSDLASKRTI